MPEIIRITPTDIKPTVDYPVTVLVLGSLKGKIEAGSWRHMSPVQVIKHNGEFLPLEANEVVAAAFLHNISVSCVVQSADQRLLTDMTERRARAMARGYITFQDWIIDSLGPDQYMEIMRIHHL